MARFDLPTGDDGRRLKTPFKMRRMSRVLPVQVKHNIDDRFLCVTDLETGLRRKAGKDRPWAEWLAFPSSTELMDEMEEQWRREHNYRINTTLTWHYNKMVRGKLEVWAHPFLYMEYAKWADVRFRVEVLKWIFDGVLAQRHNAGNYAKDMTAAMKASYMKKYGEEPKGYMYGRMHNTIKDVMGLPRKPQNIRDYLGEKDLRWMSDIEKEVITLCNAGMDFDQIHIYLRTHHHPPAIPSPVTT